MVNINEEKSVNILTSTDKEKVIKNFSGSINNAMDNNSKETHHLTTLRDTLLPKLMSGEIDVNEVKI